MAVQSISSEDLFKGLPPVIGLPRCLPKRAAYTKTVLGEVLVPDELPPYLLLGRLDRSTFQLVPDPRANPDGTVAVKNAAQRRTEASAVSSRLRGASQPTVLPTPAFAADVHRAFEHLARAQEAVLFRLNVLHVRAFISDPHEQRPDSGGRVTLDQVAEIL